MKDSSLISLLGLSLHFILFISCNSNPKSSPDNYKINVNYSIIDIELNNQRAFNVAVRIQTKITNNELIALAKRVKTDIKATSDKGVVFFLLPEMEINNGAWAAVDFLPEINTRIIGKSMLDENSAKQNLDKITDYIGLWTDNDIPGNIIIRIRMDKAEGIVKEYISSTDRRPSELATPLKRISKNGKTVFIDKESPGQYYIVEINGDLSAYDEDGFIVTYKKLK